MTGIAITRPRGVVPRIGDRQLADNVAVQTLNCKLTSGQCVPLKGLGLVHTSLAASISTFYRYRFADIYNWLAWATTVDVVRSPVAQDSIGRFYVFGDGEPRMSTYADAISGAGPYPAAWYVLGVYQPTTAMAIACSGGVSGTNEDRAYVYTFKTRYGEESGPSPATLKTGKADDVYNISGMEAAPPNTGSVSAAVANTPLPNQVTVTLNTVRGLFADEELTLSGVAGMTALNGTFKLVSVDTALNKVVVALITAQTYTSGGTWARRAPHNLTGMTKCIYRTIGTNTDYKFVAEIPVADTTFADNILSAVVAQNSGITVLDTLPPPKNAHSGILLANGVVACAAGNQICLSETGKPYSWPLANRYTVPGVIVGLIAAGNSAIILTDNYPYICTATVPEAASVAKLPGDTLAPCVSKTGIVDVGSGGMYPSNDGLYVATTGGAQSITGALYTLEEWQALMPETFKAAFSDSRYYAVHDTLGPQYASMWMLHTKENDSAQEFSENPSAIYANPYDGRLYAAKANLVSQWDSDDFTRLTASWTSKTHQLAKPINLSVAQVHAKFGDITPNGNAAYEANLSLLANINQIGGSIGDDEVGVLSCGSSRLDMAQSKLERALEFTLIRDGVAVFTKTLTSPEPFKLPADKKAEAYAVRMTGSIAWDSVNLAQGMDELRQAGV
jgi:hypothetical protein